MAGTEPDSLADALGFSLKNIQRDQVAGNFSVHLVGEGQYGETVVIENQLGRSDRAHLGKRITYLAALDSSDIDLPARPGIWITWQSGRLTGRTELHRGSK